MPHGDSVIARLDCTTVKLNILQVKIMIHEHILTLIIGDGRRILLSACNFLVFVDASIPLNVRPGAVRDPLLYSSQ